MIRAIGYHHREALLSRGNRRHQSRWPSSNYKHIHASIHPDYRSHLQSNNFSPVVRQV
jgi:hypothetical protein